MKSLDELSGPGPGPGDRRAPNNSVRMMRRNFMAGLGRGLRVVWPVISAMVLVIVGLGLVIGVIEDWRVQDSLYFSFVTGLTIGYGDLVPKTLITRVLAMCIGAIGILLMALIAAVAVKALGEIESGPPRSQ
jgi:hypothetical protein